MYRRNLLNELQAWKTAKNRKPLVLRGARQTGKTTLVELFAKGFDHFIALNLEHSKHRRFWQHEATLAELLRGIELDQNQKIIPGKTLLFLDEIQNEPRAIQSLRYFYEQMPDIHVIATGSLMEVTLKKSGFSFPVGRVSFLYSYPLTFDEFLLASGKNELRDELSQIRAGENLSLPLHEIAGDFFKEYLYVGGMPEAVAAFAEDKNYAALSTIKESLLTAFEEDVPKYARQAQVPYLTLLIQQAPLFSGQRIKYENFAESGYRSREMKRAFTILEKAMIVQRLYGTPQTKMPALPNFRVQPKMIYLDVGLAGYRFQLDLHTLKNSEINDLFRGNLAEQIVGQELLAQNAQRRSPPHFWYRNQPGSSAEVDYLIDIKGQLIPIEVKSGKAGKLRSLVQFMEQSPHPFAVRIYSGAPSLETHQTPRQKKFRLLSLPFYLTFRLKGILEEWIQS